MPKTTIIRALISGRVQGVWFRAFTHQQATNYAVNGWVRNLSDGRVEAHLEGPHSAVEAVLSALNKGPRLAKVKQVVKEEVHGENHHDFRIL